MTYNNRCENLTLVYDWIKNKKWKVNGDFTLQILLPLPLLLPKILRF